MRNESTQIEARNEKRETSGNAGVLWERRAEKRKPILRVARRVLIAILVTRFGIREVVHNGHWRTAEQLRLKLRLRSEWESGALGARIIECRCTSS